MFSIVVCSDQKTSHPSLVNYKKRVVDKLSGDYVDNVSKMKVLLALAVVVLFFGCLNTNNTPSNTPTHTQTTASGHMGSQVKKNQTTKNTSVSSNAKNTTRRGVQNEQMEHQNVTSNIKNRTAHQSQMRENQSTTQRQEQVINQHRYQHQEQNKSMNLTTISAFVQKNGPARCVVVNESSDMVQYMWFSSDDLYMKIVKSYPGTTYNVTLTTLTDFSNDRIYVNLTQLIKDYAPNNQTLLSCIASKCRWVYVENRTAVEEVKNKKIFPVNATLTSSGWVKLAPGVACEKISQMPVVPSQLKYVCNKDQYNIAIKECAPLSNQTN